MKRALHLGVILAGAFVLVSVAHAQSAERIRNFSDSITINSNSTISVVEEIDYDFGSNQKHGIYRDIPVSYKTDLGNRDISLSDIRVTDADGKPYRFSTSRSGGSEEIKIGDPNSTVTGEHTYVISYTISGAIGYFDTYDELYWNITGNGWQVPVEQASATITLPEDIETSKLQVSCYQGPEGSDERCDATLASASSTKTALFIASRSLSPGEGLTVALGFPKGVVYQPTQFESVRAIVFANWVLAVPLLALLAMFWLWFTRGKDPHGRGTVVPEYEPPQGITPLEVEALLHDRVRNSAISSEILYLATRGYLKIERLEQKILIFDHSDYRLTKLREEDGLAPHDVALLRALFRSGDTVELSDLKNKFYADLPDIKRAVMRSVVSKRYFPSDPTKVVGLYIAAAFVAFLLVMLVGGFTTLSVLSGIGTCIIVILFGMFMPRVTKAGAVMRERVKGLKMYMEVAEKARIEFHNAPQKNPQLFETLLPFAMVLSVEGAWAKQFEGIYNEPPNWYVDSRGGAFNAALFAGSMQSFSTSARSTLVSAPGGGSGSGGGGFSGGGFGGGGGGSW